MVILRIKIISAKALGVVLLSVGLVCMVSYTLAAIGPATLFTTPAGSQTVALGSNFTVSVRVSTASNVSVAGANVLLSYPHDKVQVVSVSYTGSPYNTHLEESNSGGVLKMVRAAFPKIAGGDQIFAQVQFKAIASGTAGISFTSNSYVTSGEADSDLSLSSQGVTYTIPTSVSPPPPAPLPAPPTTGSPAPTPSPVLPPPPPSASTTSNRVSSPGGAIVSAPPTKDPANSAPTGSVPVYKTELYLLEFIITDGGQKPIVGAEVILGEESVKTDTKGKAVLGGVAAGDHLITVRHQGRDSVSTITVVQDNPAKAQIFNLTTDKTSTTLPATIVKSVIMVFLMLVGLTGALVAIRYLRNRQLSKSPKTEPLVTNPSISNSSPVMNAIETGSAIAPGMVFSPQSNESSSDQKKIK